MRLLADENIQASLVHALRQDGHDIAYVAELAGGITDDEVLGVASRQGRILLTEDKDFGELVFRLKRGLPGVILIRLADNAWAERYRRTAELLNRYPDRLAGHYVVLQAERIRIRPLP